MFNTFELSKQSLKQLELSIESMKDFLEDNSELGKGYRTQLIDEIRDAASAYNCESFSLSNEAAYPNMMRGLMLRLPPKALKSYSNATFSGSERINSNIEELGRKNAVKLIAVFWKLVRFNRSSAFWKNNIERIKLLNY